MTQASKIVIAVIIAAIVVGGGFYFFQSQKVDVNQKTNETASLPPIEAVVNVAEKSYSTITLMVPPDYDTYTQEMTEFVQTGGQDPLLTTKFIKKELTIPYTKDLIKASAQAAAAEIAPIGGPAKASVAYFEIKNDTAYVLLDIDLDGWAGVSVSLGIIHPLVEETLVQFPEITKVMFDYAPGEK